ncbi:MAG: RNA methyltransferase [Erysipelotrichaceae bacterium]|nr:RNA methyltransferase [Erysipelotrichaceae bacterium]
MILVEGAISLKACIQSNKRRIDKVYIDSSKKTKDFNYLRRIIKENNIELNEISREEFSSFPIGKTHGGIIGYAEERKSDDFDEGDIFFIDGIEDPFNLGYIIRTVYAFGINNILLPKRDYSYMEAQIIKSSAGAFEMANIRYCEDSEADIKKLMEEGYTTYALKRGEDATDIFDEVFKDKALFMLGGEKRGISKGLMEICDRFIYIPYGNEFRNSLSGAAAADVCATLLFRQRRHDRITGK